MKTSSKLVTWPYNEGIIMSQINEMKNGATLNFLKENGPYQFLMYYYLSPSQQISLYKFPFSSLNGKITQTSLLRIELV